MTIEARMAISGGAKYQRDFDDPTVTALRCQTLPIGAIDLIRLPFGIAKASPVDSRNVAEVVAAILEHPDGHIGKVIELTGPKPEDTRAAAAGYSEALGRTVMYVDVPITSTKNRSPRIVVF